MTKSITVIEGHYLKMSVTDIHPSAKLEGLTYYNPEKERNEIIAGSHGHDFEIIDNQYLSFLSIDDVFSVQELIGL